MLIFKLMYSDLSNFMFFSILGSKKKLQIEIIGTTTKKGQRF